MNTETLYSIIGDMPVSEQIMTAISDHKHTEYVTHGEIEDLKRKIELLLQLVGDTSVSDQIEIALKK